MSRIRSTPADGREDAGAELAGQLDRRGADAAGAAVDQDRLAGLEPAALEHVGPDGKVGLRQAGRLDHRQPLWHRQALRRRRCAVLRVAAARDQRADRIARFPALHVGRRGDDLAGDLQPRDRRRARRRVVAALALQHVGPVDAGSVDPDQHLARLDGRHRALCRRQHFGPAEFGQVDEAHLLGDFAAHGRSSSFGWLALEDSICTDSHQGR
jgi:hypothetical protein